MIRSAKQRLASHPSIAMRTVSFSYQTQKPNTKSLFNSTYPVYIQPCLPKLMHIHELPTVRIACLFANSVDITRPCDIIIQSVVVLEWVCTFFSWQFTSPVFFWGHTHCYSLKTASIIYRLLPLACF